MIFLLKRREKHEKHAVYSCYYGEACSPTEQPVYSHLIGCHKQRGGRFSCILTCGWLTQFPHSSTLQQQKQSEQLPDTVVAQLWSFSDIKLHFSQRFYTFPLNKR